MSDEETDPALDQNLRMIPSEDLRDWLRIEKNALRDFESVPLEEKAQRARWAKSRIKRIEEEFKRRSGRLPTGRS